MEHLTPEVLSHRQTKYNILPIFLNRWSPRSFLSKEVPDEVLYTLFEAARWAPSRGNVQPWRYIIAKTKEDREKFFPFIKPSNRRWCEKAPVIAAILSKKTKKDGKPHRTHEFESGTSWGYLALEAVHQGLIAHAIGGINLDLACEILEVPDDFNLHAVIAIGYRGELNELPEDLMEKEKPSTRLPLEETIFLGTYGKSMKL